MCVCVCVCVCVFVLEYFQEMWNSYYWAKKVFARLKILNDVECFVNKKKTITIQSVAMGFKNYLQIEKIIIIPEATSGSEISEVNPTGF